MGPMENRIDQNPHRRPTLYHGTRAQLVPGSLIHQPGEYAYASEDLDAAIWAAELADGEEPPRVYRVRASGPLEDATKDADSAPTPYPTMTLRTREPLEVTGEVTTWNHYHGTHADLRPGDLIEPGHAANFGPSPRAANFVYFTRTLDASVWGAELALGEGRERIYLVEPTGPIEDDPNLTNVRFKGNPTKSFRSRAPLKVLGELTHWTGHPSDVVARMKQGLSQLAEDGIAPEDD